MTFQPGQSGNPAGRTVGSRNKQTLAVEAALFEHAHELVDELVRRAKNGERAAMRLAMERILPTGRGRPLPIELPPVRSTEDAQAAVGVIMDALKQGALSACEGVDLINVVTALTRLNGTIELIKKAARREVAKAAQTLGIDHFCPGPSAANDYARPMAEINADEDEAAELETDDLPERHPDEYRSTQDPLYRSPGAAQHEAERRDALQTRGPGATDTDLDPGLAPHRSASLHAAAHPGDERLQIVADSDDGGRRTGVG